MARLDYKTDNGADADNRLNPAERLNAYENASVDQKLKDIEGQFDNTADPSEENAKIRNLEEKNGSWTNNTGKLNSGDTASNGTSAKTPLTFRAFMKKRKTIAGAITILGILGIGGLSSLTPELLLMHILSGFLNNFNDAHVMISTKSKNTFARKINNGVRPASDKLSDCNVKCRGDTFSEKTAAAMEKEHGFTFEGEKIGDRRVVTAVHFPDGGPVVKSGEDFKTVMKDPAHAVVFTRAYNAATKPFITTRFKNMLASRFGLTKYFGLKANTTEEFKKSFRKSIGLPETPSKTSRFAALKEKLNAISTKGTAKFSGVVGYACTAKNMATDITVGLKVAQLATFASFAMPFFVSASKAQADGLPDGVMSNLGNMLTAVDDRKTLPDGSANPSYGLSATDSYGYKAAFYGDGGDMPDYAKSHVTGLPGGPLATTVGAISLLTQTPKTRAVLSALCFGQPGVDLAVMIADCIATTPVGCIVQVGTAAAAMAAMSLAIPAVVSGIIDGNLAKIDENTVGAAAGDILYPGAAAIFGGQASAYGMRAGTPSQIKNYTKLAVEVHKEDDAIARIEARDQPMNIYNQYSFLGSMATSLNLRSMAGKPVISSIGSIVANLPHAVASAFIPTTNAGTYQPLPDNKANLYKDSTDCPQLTAIGVGADQYCMPSYVATDDELNNDTDANYDYMIKNKYIDANTGAALPNTDFQKYLDNCPFRTEPLGETSHAIGDGDPTGGEYEWYIGARCQSDDEDVKNFRMYTNEDTVNALVDDTDPATKPSAGSAAANASSAGTTTANSGNVNPNGWTFPTTAGAPLVSPFGPRGSGFHTGVDLGVPSGSPFYATRDGVVLTREYNVYTVNGDGGAWCPVLSQITDPNQKDIWITHDVDGQKYTSVYGHMSQFLKKTGDVVKAGDLIGYTGGSGCSSGPHVHFEIWQGNAMPGVPGPGMLDPWPLISK